jgi:hypothetical protein
MNIQKEEVDEKQIIEMKNACCQTPYDMMQ